MEHVKEDHHAGKVHGKHLDYEKKQHQKEGDKRSHQPIDGDPKKHGAGHGTVWGQPEADVKDALASNKVQEQLS